MRDLLHRIKTLFKLAKLISFDNSGDIKKGKMFFMGNTVTGVLFSPYGTMGNPPAGSAIMAFSQNGNEANQIGITVNTKDFIDGFDGDSDYGVGNPVSKTFIHFKANGEMDIVSPEKVNVTAPDVVVNADDVEVTASNKVKVTANDIELVSSTLTHNGVNIGETHVHEQKVDSAGNTQEDTEVPK